VEDRNMSQGKRVPKLGAGELRTTMTSREEKRGDMMESTRRKCTEQNSMEGNKSGTGEENSRNNTLQNEERNEMTR
jgi:hypothetical protein